MLTDIKMTKGEKKQHNFKAFFLTFSQFLQYSNLVSVFFYIPI